MDNKSKKISRLEFLKIMGASAVAASTAGCDSTGSSSSNSTANQEPTQDKVSTRISTKGDEIGLLAYGGTRWPLLENPEEGKSVIDQDAVDELVDHAIAHGVNFFDTAPSYSQGWSEYAVGRSLSRYPRDSYYVSSKLSSQYFPDIKDPVLAKQTYHRSFELLQVDYIDYYVMHSIGRSQQIYNDRFNDNGILDFLLAEREAGRIRNLGWSFHGNRETFDWILAKHEQYHWDFIIIQLNYSDWRHATRNNVNAEYLAGELEKRNIQALVMEPLLAGRLSQLPGHIAERFLQRDPSVSVASWAFRFAASHKCVLAVMSGMTYMEHLKDNIKTYSPHKPLNQEEFDFLESMVELMMEYPTIDCTDCKYCMPCPYGIDIPGVFSHYNKCVNEGNIPQDVGDENYKKARRAYLVSYDRAIPQRRQADHCITCGKCLEHCPQSIDIPGQMVRITEYIEKLRQNM